MAKLNENKKLLVTGGVVAALCAAGSGGVYWAKGMVREKQEQIAGMRAEIASARQKIRKIPAVEHDVIILRENVHEYVKILPEENELNNFVRTASLFQKQAGVGALTKFEPGRPGKAGKGSSYKRYTYRFEFTATLWQFLKFLNLFESHERFIKVKSFTLTSGESRGSQASGGTGDVRHRIAMEVETYVYKGSPKGKDVVIPNYRNKVEKLREEILAQRQTITTGGYRFQGARGRRDIFVDPRESALGPRAGTVPVRDQKRIIAKFRDRIAEARKIRRRMQDKSITIFERYALGRKLQESLAAIEKDVEQVNHKGFIASPMLKFTWTKEVVDPLAKLKLAVTQEAARSREDRWLAAKDMRKLLDSMKDDLRAGELRAAVNRYVTVQDKLRVPRADPRFELAAAIEDLYLRAKMADEFSQIQLAIQGICVNEDGRSAVILNGSVYEEGDYVEDDLLLKSVARDQVEFVYKGFTVVKAL